MYTKPKTATGAITSSGGGVVYANTQASGRAGYADKAGRAAIADKAEYADKAGLAENVNIEAEVLRHFLRSDEEDTAEKRITFAEGLSSEAASTFKKLLTLLGGLTLSDGIHGITDDGIATLKEIVSAAFRSGALGSGFKLGNYSDSEDSYLEVDRLLVRKAAEFVKLVIRELQSVGGEIVLSPAAMKISNVVYFEKGVYLPEYEELPLRYNVYRCYFSQKKGDEEIENQFVEGDLVRCQTFNVKKGVNGNVKNRYYWRKVYKVGKDFIDVLADFGDTGSDVPQAGDELVQMGNVYDTDRQSVVVLSAYGADAPSLKMYEGVDSYSLENKEDFVLSRKEMFAIADKFRFITRNANGEIKSTQSFAELVMSVDGLRTTVDGNKSEVDGQITQMSSQITQTANRITALTQQQTAMGNKISKIEQSTEKISLQVETTTNLKNCIVGSAFRKWDSYTTNNSNYPVTFHTGGVGGSHFLRISSVGASANTWAGISLDCAGMKANTRYTCSVWFRTRTKPDSEVYMRVSGKSSASGTFSIYSTQWFTPTGSTDEWTLYKWSFTTPASVYAVKVDLVVLKNGTIHLCRPMIMEGTEYGGWSLSPYDKTEAGKLESGLKRAGIDLEDDTITATANKFMVKNNSGEVTASVNEDGLLEVGAGLFSGLIRKKKTIITPDKLEGYTEENSINGYIRLNFVKTGSFVEFLGDIGKKTGGNYPTIILPFHNPNASNASLGVTSEEAATCLGQTFIVRNNTSPAITINIVGYTSLVGGSNATHPYWLERGWMAVLTCEFVYVSNANTYAIVWNGYNVPFSAPIAHSDEGEEAVADEGGEPTADDPTTTEEEQPKE